MEEIGVTKSLYKIELYLIKVIPYGMAGCYFLNSVLSYFNIEAPILSLIGGLSILPFMFLYLSSFVFRFCIYHRLPLYYMLISDIISYYDIYIGLEISSRNYFTLNAVLAGITIIFILLFKFKLCKKD